MSWPYFQTVSPFLMSTSATLWPIGTSILDFSLNDELSWVTTHSMSVPFFRPSTTTTPTVSFLSCTSNCGIAIVLPAVLELGCLIYRPGDRRVERVPSLKPKPEHEDRTPVAAVPKSRMLRLGFTHAGTGARMRTMVLLLASLFV